VAGVAAAELTRAIENGAEALLRRQRTDGAFEDDPPASILGTAGTIAALAAADPAGCAEEIEAGANWLREQQHPDGGWGGVAGADSEVVATVVALTGLRLAASETSLEAVEAGRACLARLGGVGAVAERGIALLCRQLLTMAGLTTEAGSLHRLPLEIVVFGRVRRQRISFRTAPFIGLALMQDDLPPARGLHRTTLRRAHPTAVRLLRSIYDHEGRTGAMSEDPWLASLVLLGLVRSGEAPDLAKAITKWLRHAIRPDGAWDLVSNLDLTRSGYAVAGLIAAGYAADERLDDTREFFHNRQQAKAFEVWEVPPGGWSYSNACGWPVTLESAEILSALAGYPDAKRDPVLRSGLAWLIERQDKRGSWSLWVRDTKLADDGPCPVVTSQAITALHDAGYPDDHRVITRATGWLLGQQRPDGTFENVRYRDHTGGTAMVVTALARVGLREHEVVQRAIDWLVRTQLPDGSWGPGGGTDGSAEETGWAVQALVTAAGPAAVIDRGVGWLLAAAQPDGGWQASPVCSYLRHHLCYPNGVLTQAVALRALGAYRDAADRG
jgi:squalene-hopene/tetraprenyl-beta-curcumene cyclase